MCLLFDIIKNIVAKKSGNAVPKLLMFVFVRDSALLLELHSEVPSYIHLTSGLRSLKIVNNIC
jgi:hypothetical protein